MEPQLATLHPWYNGQVLLVKAVDDAQGALKAFSDSSGVPWHCNDSWDRAACLLDEPGTELQPYVSQYRVHVWPLWQGAQVTVSNSRDRAKADRTLESPKPSTGQKNARIGAHARLFSRPKRKNETVVAPEAASPDLASPNECRDAAALGITKHPFDPTVEGQSPRESSRTASL